MFAAAAETPLTLSSLIDARTSGAKATGKGLGELRKLPKSCVWCLTYLSLLAGFGAAAIISIHFLIRSDVPFSRPWSNATDTVAKPIQLAASDPPFQLARGYRCDPTTCILPACLCPSFSPPGGLVIENTPQFVLITFDDYFTPQAYRNVSPIFDGVTNPNGCPIKGTFFTQILTTHPATVTRLHAEGHEIADHTFSHPNWADDREVAAMIEASAAYFGVPKTDIKGFRAPYLQGSYSLMKSVKDAGLLWQSSGTTEIFNSPWPYTLDNGFAAKCAVGVDCSIIPSLGVPGLWDIPMGVYYPNNSHIGGLPQDPDFGSTGDTVAALLDSFNLHYNNGRMPFGLWYHAWNNFVNHTQVSGSQFIKEIQQAHGDNIWFVTGSQLIRWMQHPVPISGMAQFMDCTPPPPKSVLQDEYYCDGLDDNGNGEVDEFVASSCYYNTTRFHSCYGCPSPLYTLENPAPPAGCSPLDPHGEPQTSCPPAPPTVNRGGVPVNVQPPNDPINVVVEGTVLLGCFDSRGVRPFNSRRQSASVVSMSSCIEACWGDGFSYASMYGGDACYCGSGWPITSNVGLEQCDLPCHLGNTTQICGGMSAATVYQILRSSSHILHPFPALVVFMLLALI
ncbi:UNVERIFIED_CONTAM: hypothetical protein HDU68_007421 [Siphonaria sp. JEL0065]|nr:hypothetical protein HDU68_007421 [Siphonaria sp. JEL0065]